MGKVILIHANCHDSTAKGDFSFAGNIAKDLTHELRGNKVNDIDVILVSPLDGITGFKSMYGSVDNGRVSVEGTDVGLSSLEEFDAVENTVIAFIDANRCKYSAADLVKRVLSPESKIVFVGNLNQSSFTGLFLQALYRMQAQIEQPGVYDFFYADDILLGSAGFDQDRLGLTTITKAKDLPRLSSSDESILPKGNYGFGYLASVKPSKDYKLIAQYFKLSDQDRQILVGDFTSKASEIQDAYDHDLTLTTSKFFPKVEYHHSLPNGVMRNMVANAAGSLILSTGVTSTLEAMQDSKLPYYQNRSNNTEFVAAYLIAVKSIISNDNSLFGALPQMIIDLSSLLFGDKPLSCNDMNRTDYLLKMSSITSRLIRINHTILAQASGKIAPRLLGFLNSARKTKDHVQLSTVCASLRKEGEAGSPVHDQALRRAAMWGRLFELKVLIKSMSIRDMDKADPVDGLTALHWAVLSKNYDCARTLVKAGLFLDLQDKKGQTALHKAVQNGDRAMIKILIEAGACVNIADNVSNSPKDCAWDSGILLFINDCHFQLSSPTSAQQVSGF